MDISVVIPCRNGEPFLSKQIDALLSQRTDVDFEVVVADNASTDGTAALVRSYADPRVRLADASRAPGVNVARNVGVSVARGQYILLTDADDFVHEGWIEAFGIAFRDGAEAVGGGLDRILEDGTLLASERQLYSALAGRFRYANGTNCGFTRDLYDAVGGFDESFKGGADEIDFFLRATKAGYPVELVADAVVSKVQHTDLKRVFTQHLNFGRGEARLVRKHRPAWLILAIFAAAIQSVLWGAAWVSLISRRKTTSSLAFSWGLLTGLFA